MAEDRLKQDDRLRLQANTGFALAASLPVANNNDGPAQIQLRSMLHRTAGFAAEATKSSLLQWLMRISNTDLCLDGLREERNLVWFSAEPTSNQADHPDLDWLIVTSLSGHSRDEFMSAGTNLPLTAAEVAHFRRNHRDTDLGLARKFRKPNAELPESVQSLYLLYQERAYTDVEAALFIAQSSGSTRVARLMADLQAIGSFCNAHHVVHYNVQSYSVATAFDTSELIDVSNHEAASRLVMPVNHPAHLLKFSPEDIAALASLIVEKHMLSPTEFADKALMLAEARQDVNRFASPLRFRVAVLEEDLPSSKGWVRRIGLAYSRLFASWVADIPQLGLPPHNQRAASA